MTNEDMKLLENLLEEFCAKSDCCKNCSYKHKDGNRYFCYFGAKCIFENLKKSIDK